VLTEHIELPDPELYRRIVTKNSDGGSALSKGASPFRVQASRALGTASSFNSVAYRRLDLCTCSSVEETKAVVKEMQKRLSVARSLLGLEV
jgi:hypothetical protein